MSFSKAFQVLSSTIIDRVKPTPDPVFQALRDIANAHEEDTQETISSLKTAQSLIFKHEITIRTLTENQTILQHKLDSNATVFKGQTASMKSYMDQIQALTNQVSNYVSDITRLKDGQAKALETKAYWVSRCDAAEQDVINLHRQLHAKQDSTNDTKVEQASPNPMDVRLRVSTSAWEDETRRLGDEIRSLKDRLNQEITEHGHTRTAQKHTMAMWESCRAELRDVQANPECNDYIPRNKYLKAEINRLEGVRDAQSKEAADLKARNQNQEDRIKQLRQRLSRILGLATE